MTTYRIAMPERRGVCPGLSRPLPTGDGLLVRLMPIGTIALDAFAALCAAARRHGTGIVEITARGSIQIRGLNAGSASKFANEIAALGMAAALLAGHALGSDASYAYALAFTAAGAALFACARHTRGADGRTGAGGVSSPGLVGSGLRPLPTANVGVTPTTPARPPPPRATATHSAPRLTRGVDRPDRARLPGSAVFA